MQRDVTSTSAVVAISPISCIMSSHGAYEEDPRRRHACAPSAPQPLVEVAVPAQGGQPALTLSGAPRESAAKRLVRPFAAHLPLAPLDGIGDCGINVFVWCAKGVVERNRVCSTVGPVHPCLRARDVLPRGLVVLPVGVPPIPRQAQSLLLLRSLGPAHELTVVAPSEVRCAISCAARSGGSSDGNGWAVEIHSDSSRRLLVWISPFRSGIKCRGVYRPASRATAGARAPATSAPNTK